MISAVIVNFNKKELLKKCLDSVLSQDFQELEVIVVDNASSDGSVDLLTAYPGVKLIQNSRNELFCKAYNTGIDAGKGDYVLCLNNDVELEKDYLNEVLSAIKLDERIGMVSGKVLRDDRRTIDSTGLFLGKRRKPIERGYNRIDKGQYDDPGYVFGVGGACAFFRRSFLEDVKDENGYFDERFGFYYEDLDLCWRGQKRNWKAYYTPKAVAYHVRAATATSGKRGMGPNIFYVSDELRALYIRNRYLCMKKNETPLSFLCNLPFILLYEVQLVLITLISKFLRAKDRRQTDKDPVK